MPVLDTKDAVGVYGESNIYTTWLTYAEERDLFKNYFEKNIQMWAKKSPLSIVEFGCGSGATAIRLIKILEKAGIAYTYTGVEPYKEQLDIFKDKTKNNPNIHYILSSIEEVKLTKIYDVAFAVHSLYYVANMQEAIKKMLACSQKTVIVHHGPHGIHEVHETFRDYVKQGPHIISTYNDVAQILEEEKIPFHLDTFPSIVNVYPIKEAENEDGKNLIKFFLERTDLSDTSIEEVRSYFRKKSDTMIHDVGIFITKNT